MNEFEVVRGRNARTTYEENSLGRVRPISSRTTCAGISISVHEALK